MTKHMMMTAGVAIALMLAPAMAMASCEQVAGKHSGHFNLDKREEAAGGARPDHVTGDWTATIDGATCAVTGEADSPLTGKVQLTGTFGTYNADTSKFKPTNLYMEVTGNPDFIGFVFKNDAAKHLLRYVEVETPDYLYVGDFDGK